MVRKARAEAVVLGLLRGAVVAIALWSAPSAWAQAERPDAQSPYSRSAWGRALAAADFETFSQLLYSAQKASFPSTANEVATAVALRSKSLPAEERDAAGIPEFRLEAARYLALADRSNVLKTHAKPLRALAREFIGKDHRLESKALSVLAHLRDEADVAVIAAVARSEDPNRYRTAVHALRVMCRPGAEKALQAIAQASQSEEKRRYIRESQQLEKICGAPTA